MIEQIRSNILLEATNLLKTQHNKNDFGISFDDLFKINTMKDIDKNSIDDKDLKTYEVEINVNENFQGTITDDTAKNKSLDQQSNKEFKVKDNVLEKKADTKENIDKTKVDLKKNIHLVHDLKTPAKDDLKITLKFKNTELKPNLDPKTKERIKKVLEDLKNGKINESVANEFILQIIKNANIKDFASLKNRDIDIKIKNSSTVKKENPFSLNFENKNNKVESDKDFAVGKLKNNENSNIENSLFKSKEQVKGSAKKDSLNKLEVKNENNTKELKTEIKVEILDNKMPNFVNGRDRVLNEPQKILEQNRNVLFQEIAKNTKIVLGQNQTKFSTMIRPENFGRIDFNFVVKDGKVNGRMILQNKDVADFFKANVQEIKAVFQKSNVELENLDIILAGNRFGEMADNNSNSNNGFLQNENFSLNNNFNSKYIDTFEENISSSQQNYSAGEISRINLVI